MAASALGTRAPLAIPQGPNQRWSLDFLSDAFADGRRFRILAVVDDFTREYLALVADTSLPGLRVVRELGTVVARRGRPAMCVSDNGTELTSMAILRWSQETRIEWHYIAPGKPTQNAFIERGEGLRKSWRDGKTQVLETFIDQIVDGLEAHLVAAQLRREKCERRQAEHRELERRRGLAKARRKREQSRKALLAKLITAERRAAQFREWIADKKCLLTDNLNAKFSRMTSWVRGQLAVLEAILDAEKLTADIRERNLFPEVDDLQVPLGEPPERRFWYARVGNAIAKESFADVTPKPTKKPFERFKGPRPVARRSGFRP